MQKVVLTHAVTEILFNIYKKIHSVSRNTNLAEGEVSLRNS